MGQSLWLDNITRGLLTSGTLRRYIQEFSVSGLTSNLTIFDLMDFLSSLNFNYGPKDEIQANKPLPIFANHSSSPG
jgi:hypothetical protein